MSTMLPMTFGNPKSKNERIARDALLTKSLRDDTMKWSYASEYPLVLGPDGDVTSWCSYSGDQLVAHANLWPRKLQNVSGTRTLPIGLIGNVATCPAHRGHGHMSTLMSYLAQVAHSQGLQALVLWSDLFKFYQNLGFTSIGREWRFRITQGDRPQRTGIDLQELHLLNDNGITALMSMRPKLEWTLDRSIEEFRTLLRIPDTHLFIRRKGQHIASWMVIGKGSDMRGVIHEWGAISPSELISDIHSLLQDLDIPELILLTPGHLHQHWLIPLKEHSAESTEHSMALGLPIGPNGKDALASLAKGFIWGLDSI